MPVAPSFPSPLPLLLPLSIYECMHIDVLKSKNLDMCTIVSRAQTILQSQHVRLGCLPNPLGQLSDILGTRQTRDTSYILSYPETPGLQPVYLRSALRRTSSSSFSASSSQPSPSFMYRVSAKRYPRASTMMMMMMIMMHNSLHPAGSQYYQLTQRCNIFNAIASAGMSSYQVRIHLAK